MNLSTPLDLIKNQNCQEIFIYLFVMLVIITILVMVSFMLYNKTATKKRISIEKNYVKRIDELSKIHIKQIEKIRINSNKRDEERSRQWFESEKETLKVLGGVSKLLDLNEKVTDVESSKIMLKLNEIHNIIKRFGVKSIDDE